MPRKRGDSSVWLKRVGAHLDRYGDAQWDKFPWKDELSYANRRRYVRELLGVKVKVPKGKQSLQAVAGIRHADLEQPSSPIALMHHVDKMLRICDLLDKHAVNQKKNELNDAGDARESLKARCMVLNTAVNAQEKLYGSARIQEVHNLMFDAIKEESPETASRIMEKIKRIDQDHGLGL